MIETLVFLASAGILLSVGQYLLPKCGLLHRAPRWGISVWQALIGSAVACVLLGLVGLSMPNLSAAATVAELLRACAIEFEAQYSSLTGTVVTSAGVITFGALATRISFSLSRQRWHNQQAQRSHHASLAILARKAANGIVVVDHGAAAVYCVPGHRGSGTEDTVVVSTGALQALDDSQLALVLRHEQAHLSANHSQLISRARALKSAFPRVPFFRVAHDQIALLSEMHADDAVSVHDRQGLAEALYALTMANSQTVIRPPDGTLAGTLGAANSNVMLRARRLLSPHQPLTRPVALVLATTVIMLALLPVSLALAAAGIDEPHPCCQFAPLAANHVKASSDN